MVHIEYDVNAVKYEDFFPFQEGGGNGGGAARSLYFEGMPYQRGFGRGIGMVFKSLLRYLLPMVKSAAPVVRKEGLETGARILSDIAEGVPVKEAIVHETQEGIKNIAKKSLKKSFKHQFGSGKRRTRKRKAVAGRSVRKSRAYKKRRSDSLGFY